MVALPWMAESKGQQRGGQNEYNKLNLVFCAYKNFKLLSQIQETVITHPKQSGCTSTLMVDDDMRYILNLL